jgi:hypothetical protein
MSTLKPTSRARMLCIGIILLYLLSAPILASSEETSPAEDLGLIDQMTQILEAEQTNRFAPTILPIEVLAPETAQSMQQALKAYYDYRTVGYEHRRSVFRWQLLPSKIIFVIVVLLVSAGIYFSWLQFIKGLRTDKDRSSTETTFEASASGIKVSSPVLGVIILVISLAFFYLYLVYVYPIEEIL